MASRLFSLRLNLLVAAFRGTPSRVARRIAGGMLALAGGVMLAVFPVWITADSADRFHIDTVVVSVVSLTALVVPFFANRGHLEPRQFAGFPLTSAQVARGLLITTVVSWPALWVVAFLGSFVVARSEWRQPWWAVALAAVAVLAFAVSGARLMSALAKLVVHHRARGAIRAAGWLVLIAALPVVVFAVTQALTTSTMAVFSDVAVPLGWTPLGAPVAALSLASEGAFADAAARFLIAFAGVGILVGLWAVVARASLRRIDPPADPHAAREGLDWFERFPPTPSAVIAARSLTYWIRDPRYRVALAAIPVTPVFVVLALWIAGVDVHILASLPLPIILLLLGWSLHNDVAMDSTAVWMHVASGTRGRHDRLGRLAPVLFLGVPLVGIGSSVTVTLLGDWRLLPAVLGLNFGVLAAAAAAASIFSALLPYPATRPGDSPFAQPVIVGSGSGLAQVLSMLAALLLSVPPVWVAVQGMITPSFGENLWALVFGVGYGVVVLAGGVLAGGILFERSAPELLAVAQTFD